MNPDRMLDLVGLPGGPLADATLWRLEVIEAGALTPTLHRVVLTAPGLDGLRYVPGQDLMLRVPQGGDRVVNRRYTIRSFDATLAAVIMDVSLHGAGPGTDWIRGASIGDQIEAIGPRGKITLRENAHWHLFVGDVTGLPGALAMIEALPTTSPPRRCSRSTLLPMSRSRTHARCHSWTCIGFTDPVVRCRVMHR